MASTKDTKPTQVGGHQPAPSVGSPRIDVAQQIDGRLYSARRAALIHTNAKGESLYYDSGPGYFVVSVSRFIGNTPCYAVQPMSDEGLRQWATANGVRVRGDVVFEAGRCRICREEVKPDRQKRKQKSTALMQAKRLERQVNLNWRHADSADASQVFADLTSR